MDHIEIVEYDERWASLFLEEAKIISGALGEQEFITIEHVGSTAIPNMAAKPIIDIIIVVQSLEQAKLHFVQPLEKLDYVFWPDNPDESEMFFVKGMPPYGERRTHHIRVMEEGKKLQNKRLFRDWLIEYPEDADRYKALKKDLAIQFKDDREAYTKAKDDFVKEILSKTKSQ